MRIMKVLDGETEQRIDTSIVGALLGREYDLAMDAIPRVVDDIHANIPDNKRVSYGIVYAIKVLSEYLDGRLLEAGVPIFPAASHMLRASTDAKCRGVSLGLLSFHGAEDFKSVLPHFESAAASPDWGTREFAQMFFRRLIKHHPEKAREYLLRLAKSEDANVRRFVGETLRPVQENRWFYRNPDYPLSIIKEMFKESSAYARTSVGNNLSDLARQCPETVYDVVGGLVENGDRNSYWIAYRACRNLVKTDALKVMDLLKVDEYRYKERIYKRSDYHRD
jgi:3-methyladenine DNA glycosylase AlkC